jgi:hypothetical protein
VVSPRGVTLAVIRRCDDVYYFIKHRQSVHSPSTAVIAHCSSLQPDTVLTKTVVSVLIDLSYVIQ